MRKSILAIIICGGLASGYGLAELLWPASPRAIRAFHLFETVCLKPDPDMHTLGLVPLSDDFGVPMWADQKSQSFLRQTPRGCTITSVDGAPFTTRDARAVAAWLTDLVPQKFPDLPVDPKARLGEVSVAWLTGTPSDRWGVFFFSGRHVGSTLSYRAAPDPGAASTRSRVD